MTKINYATRVRAGLNIRKQINALGSGISVRAICLILILLLSARFGIAGEGLPIARLTTDNIDQRLRYAHSLWEEGRTKPAIEEIEKQLAQDSTLLTDAAIVLGGNYHLVRVTNNVFADRIGGFSPLGDKLVYARDTSMIRLDDGLFKWYEDRTTGIVYYDFNNAAEIAGEIPQPNPLQPRFLDQQSFVYLAKDQTGAGDDVHYRLYLYDLKQKTAHECFTCYGQDYCVYQNGIVNYDENRAMFTYRKPDSDNERILFDNDDWLSFKRPLPMIMNLSAGNDIILFEAGYQFGKSSKNIYSLPLFGGQPQILTTNRKEYSSDGSFCPAAVNANEYAFFNGRSNRIDIYYRVQGKDYQLTYDRGNKQYLTISPVGDKIAYSYMIEKDGVESLEIFILDFSQDATIEDIKYRINNID
jgi:Tol biopolymer transport system component